MPRLSFRRPVENTLRKLQTDPQITVSRRPTDWNRNLNAEESRIAKHNKSRFSFYKSHPPTYIHPQHPERKNTREPTFRFYESVPPTYIGSARTLRKPGILQPAEPPVASIYSDIKFQKKWVPSFEGQTVQILRQDLPRSAERQPAQKGDIPPLQTQSFSHTASIANMSDDAYSKFLEGANDTGATAQESKSYKTKSVNTNVPKALESVEEYYTSDADEPFEPVSLEFEGSDISADELKKLIGHNADVSSIGEKEFDPQGQYKKVTEAVKKAGDGKVKVFRVEHGSTRAEYYVVSVDDKEGRIVGLKALSVES